MAGFLCMGPAQRSSASHPYCGGVCSISTGCLQRDFIRSSVLNPGMYAHMCAVIRGSVLNSDMHAHMCAFIRVSILIVVYMHTCAVIGG